MIQPKVAFLGNLAIDHNHYVIRNENEKHFGGACLYSAISGSLFYPVYIISKTGFDYDFSLYEKIYNCDFSFVNKVENLETNVFENYIYSSDGSIRCVLGKVPKQFAISASEIHPVINKNISHFHFTTNDPERIVNIIHFLRKKHPNITISIDTIEDFSNLDLTAYLYDMVDIAIIDDTYERLLQCKAPIKVIKHGKYGCSYYSASKQFDVKSEIISDVVDPIGAGDCLNGVLITLLINGITPEQALYVANRVATEFVKDYGLYHLTLKKEFINENKEYLGRTPK